MEYPVKSGYKHRYVAHFWAIERIVCPQMLKHQYDESAFFQTDVKIWRCGRLISTCK